MWSTWSYWGGCTVSCGGGSQTRDRVCINGDIGQVGCIGGFIEDEPCNIEVKYLQCLNQ